MSRAGHQPTKEKMITILMRERDLCRKEAEHIGTMLRVRGYYPTVKERIAKKEKATELFEIVEALEMAISALLAGKDKEANVIIDESEETEE